MELKLAVLGAAIALTISAGSAQWDANTKTLTLSDDSSAPPGPAPGTGPGGIPTRWWNGDGNGPQKLLQWTSDNNYPYYTTLDKSKFGYGTKGPSTDFSSTAEPGYVVMVGTGYIPAETQPPNPAPQPQPQPVPTDGSVIRLPQQPGVDGSGALIYPMNGQRRTQSSGLGGNRTLEIPTTIPADISTSEPNRLRFWRIAPVPGNPVCMRNIEVSVNGAVVQGLEFQPPGNWGTEPGFNYTIGNPEHHVGIGAIANFQPADQVLMKIQNPNGESSDILCDVSDAG